MSSSAVANFDVSYIQEGYSDAYGIYTGVLNISCLSISAPNTTAASWHAHLYRNDYKKYFEANTWYH